jgi:hypothetical protein
VHSRIGRPPKDLERLCLLDEPVQLLGKGPQGALRPTTKMRAGSRIGK